MTDTGLLLGRERKALRVALHMWSVGVVPERLERMRTEIQEGAFAVGGEDFDSAYRRAVGLALDIPTPSPECMVRAREILKAIEAAQAARTRQLEREAAATCE